MKSLLKNVDWQIFLTTLFISLLSLLMIFSLNSQLVKDQVVFLFIGFFFFFLLAKFDYKILEDFSSVLFIVSLFLLAVNFLFGQRIRGSVRWVQIGGLSFQASEFVKPLLILVFSSFAAKLNFLKIRDFFIFLFLLIIPGFLIFKQPDLGSSLVIAAIWVGILIYGKVRKTFIIGGLAVFFLLLPLLWNFLKPYQRDRVLGFLNPSFDPLGSGYHLLQAKITVGSGQLLGRGLGQGTQSQLRFLPESHTDFIFASLAEELGFLGSSLLFLAYLFLLLRILTFSRRSSDKFGAFICIGVFSMIFFQFFVNLGMNLGILPITGITLPLFSFGGSSLVTTFISLGLVQSVSHSLKRQKVIEIK